MPNGPLMFRPYLSRAISFWFLAVVLTSLLFAASAPSPLYRVYQAMWHFSPIVLTAVYAVYGFGALFALLMTGQSSDYVGRRRVTFVALIVQVSGMLAFIAATRVEWLFLGRILQGLGTGMAIATISAWLLDLQPPEHPQMGSLIGGIAPIAGLALGGVGSAALVELAPDPQHLVFWVLTAAYTAALALTPLLPDVVKRAPGFLASMRPKVAVPSPMRPMFAALAPSFIATWAVAGLYLSLGPSLAISLLGSESHLVGGMVIAALLGTAAIAILLVRTVPPQATVIGGSLVLIVGLAITLAAVWFDSLLGLLVGSVVTGFGFGPAFSGVFRSLVTLAPPDQRAALVAAIYILLYASFSVPAVMAGVTVTLVGLRTTTLAFGLIAIALAAITTVAVSRRLRSAA